MSVVAGMGTVRACRRGGARGGLPRGRNQGEGKLVVSAETTFLEKTCRRKSLGFLGGVGFQLFLTVEKYVDRWVFLVGLSDVGCFLAVDGNNFPFRCTP